jgi:phosphomannomutase
MVVLEVMSRATEPLSELLAPYRRYADSGEINTKVRDPVASTEAVARYYAGLGHEIDRTDGITVDLGQWWFNLRSSNTEPLLRLNVEARTPSACEEHVDELVALVNRL